jgi:guanine deaminase
MPMTNTTKTGTQALRGAALTFTGDPFQAGIESTLRYESDAIVAMADGKFTHIGPAREVRSSLPPGTAVKENGKDTLMVAGFIDSHAHFPQTPMIAAYGEQLPEWLDKYAFPTELICADKEFAREVAKVFLQENVRNGITSGCV